MKLLITLLIPLSVMSQGLIDLERLCAYQGGKYAGLLEAKEYAESVRDDIKARTRETSTSAALVDLVVRFSKMNADNIRVIMKEEYDCEVDV